MSLLQMLLVRHLSTNLMYITISTCTHYTLPTGPEHNIVYWKLLILFTALTLKRPLAKTLATLWCHMWLMFSNLRSRSLLNTTQILKIRHIGMQMIHQILGMFVEVACPKRTGFPCRLVLVPREKK